MQSLPAPSAPLRRSRRAFAPCGRRRAAPAPAAARGVLVFIDPRATECGHLVATPQPCVIPLDPHGNGLRQVAAVLAITPGVRAAVLAASGAAGHIALGDAVLSPATLVHHAMALRALGRALGPQGILLFYGDAAAENEHLMPDIARLARLQVAACPDLSLIDGMAAPATRLPASGWMG